VAVASTGPYANHLHLTADRWPGWYLTTHTRACTHAQFISAAVFGYR